MTALACSSYNEGEKELELPRDQCRPLKILAHSHFKDRQSTASSMFPRIPRHQVDPCPPTSAQRYGEKQTHKRLAKLDCAASSKGIAEWGRQAYCIITARSGLASLKSLDPNLQKPSAICIDSIEDLELVKAPFCFHVYHVLGVRRWFGKGHDTGDLQGRGTTPMSSFAYWKVACLGQATS